MHVIICIGMMETLNASAVIVIQYPVYPTHRIPEQAESIYEGYFIVGLFCYICSFFFCGYFPLLMPY
jgi:ABC-type multidrug transport system permease subunit